MLQTERDTRDAVASENPIPVGRRNLPRASHACQRCRLKKAKCDQRQPCTNCIKHSISCEYGIRRRSGRRKNQPTQGEVYRETSKEPTAISSSGSVPQDHDEPNGNRLPRQAQESTLSGLTPRTFSVLGSDVVGDINQHTHGTEFYGTSSNFVLLNQLFAFAEQHLPPGHASSSRHQETSYLSPSSFNGIDQLSIQSRNSLWTSGEQCTREGLTTLPQGRISIINLLSNEEALSPPSRPKTPPRVTDNQQIDPVVPSVTSGRAADEASSDSALHGNPIFNPQSNRSEHNANHPTPLSTHSSTSNRPITVTPIQAAERRLEREYVRVFMDNLHYLHPMLDSVVFAERCQREIWDPHTAIGRKKSSRHFFALYNIVVAIGALIAGSNVTKAFTRDIQMCMEQLRQTKSSGNLTASQALSRMYFRRSRGLLGDIFEVCSLESTQTLLLMSLYCQNSHKPHACYMYCGQAVRTALAIGLANESTSTSAENRKAARRTWWCIYSHEIDMSCSSGRRDCLGKPRNYQIPLPLIGERNVGVPDTPEMEDKSVAMVNEMVHLATVLRRISKELYHDSKGLTLLEKSMVAKELDGLLSDWKSRLPEWLDFGRISLREEEWAAKQKLVLHLRYLNAKILAHRPFMVPSGSEDQFDRSIHVESCLDAARQTIQTLYDAYAHRHYFRTWWYNSTYTLYAGMIVLYVVMLRDTSSCSDDLLSDVTKAQSILQSMEDATVARRSAELLREGLEVAQACIQYRQGNYRPSEETRSDHVNDRFQTHAGMGGWTPHADHNISQTIFASTGHDLDPRPLLASLIDPSLLQDFTAEIGPLSSLDVSASLFDDFYGDKPGPYLESMFQ